MNEDQGQMCIIDDIKTVKQETYYYCAAACIKMCLKDEKEQEEIFNELKERTKDKENWYADPGAVYSYLAERIDCDRLSELVRDSFEAAEKIVSCIASTRFSAPMLVSKGKHWVLYSGYQLDDAGYAKGIYIRDPWPTTTGLTFYPFGKYFFDEYFGAIDAEGEMKGKIEAFVSKGMCDCVKIKKIPAKPQYGGGVLAIMDVSCFIDDIINEDMHSFGFKNFKRIRGGGAYFDNCLVYEDITYKPKYLLTFLEINEQLSIAAINVDDRSIIAIIAVNTEEYDLYSMECIAQKLKNRYNIDISKESLRFVEDKRFSISCFAPCIDVPGLGRVNLSLDKVSFGTKQQKVG